MAHIQRLGIQGVRSFDPEKSQEIKFFPLTLIVGPNGAGKTTIIESLKYATTGSLPPNCNGGKSFVHDVQFAGKPIIRGQIRLRFTDVEQKSTTIIRSMQSSLKYQKDKPQITFKQLNSVIRREDQTNDQKVADVNSAALELIGVSKAVLNNVIFCHQEDTNWPLSEGKVLKEKFDDIFGSLGYVKVLEKIKKTRDEETKNLKLLEKDVIIYGNLKKETDSKLKNLDNENAKLDTEKAKVKELHLKIKDAQEKLENFIEMESSADDLMKQISQIEGSIAEKLNLANGIKKNCNKITLLKNKSQVDQELSNFEGNSKKMIAKKDDLEEKLKKDELRYNELNSSKKKIDADIFNIKQCESQIRKLTAERNSLIFKIEEKSTELELILSKINNKEDLNESDCRTAIQHYEKQIEQIQSSIVDKCSTNRKREIELKQNLDSLKSQKSNASHEKELRRKEIHKIEKELTELNQKLSYSGVSDNQIKSLDEKIVHYKSLLSKFNNVNDEEMKENIVKLEGTKCELKDEIERLEKQIAIANANNEERIKFDILVAQRDEKDSKIQEIKQKHSEVYWEVDADEGSFSIKLNEHINKINSQYEQSNTRVGLNEKEYYTKKSKLESQQELLNTRNVDLVNHKGKFEGLCEIDRFESFLNQKEKELNEFRSEKASLSNMSPVIDCQISIIDKHEMCPVCENDLSISWISKKSGNNLDKLSLVKNLEKTKSENPNDMKQIELKIKEGEQFYNKLLRLKTDFESIHNITNEIPSIKAELTNLRENTESLQKTIEKEKMNSKCSREKIESLRKCLQDANHHDNSCKELKDIKQKLEQFDNSKWSDGVDIDGLTCKLKDKQANLKATDNELTVMQTKRIKESEEKIKLQNYLQTAERNKIDFEKKERDKIDNLDKQKDLKAQLGDLKQKISHLDGKSQQFDPEIERLDTDLRILSDELKRFEKDKNQNIYLCQDLMKRLSNLFSEISKRSKELDQLKLKTSREYIDQLENDIQSSEHEITITSKELKEVSQNITSLELQKRELEDYHRFLELQLSISEQEERLKENKKKMGYMDLSSIKRSRINAEKELTGLETKSKLGMERTREIDDRISELSSELNEDQYATADRNFKEKTIDKTISDVTCDDLNKYYKALDFSISSFHKCKMEEINKLLKKFWEIAYQGKDIDYIKILSDEEERSASDKRRSYNYRVVMVRKGKEMDMKGRCSAGQKVLASLIIRLALALIFCRNFAVLTLDEPTTNLDKANIHSFANAVISLIKSNRNFQIIIITHDEEFLDCLDTDTGGEYYYKVFKNDSGYSSIIRKSINQDANIFVSQKPQTSNDSKKRNENDDEEVHLAIAPKRPKLANNTNNNTSIQLPSTGSFFDLENFEDGLD